MNLLELLQQSQPQDLLTWTLEVSTVPSNFSADWPETEVQLFSVDNVTPYYGFGYSPKVVTILKPTLLTSFFPTPALLSAAEIDLFHIIDWNDYYTLSYQPLKTLFVTTSATNYQTQLQHVYVMPGTYNITISSFFFFGVEDKRLMNFFNFFEEELDLSNANWPFVFENVEIYSPSLSSFTFSEDFASRLLNFRVRWIDLKNESLSSLWYQRWDDFLGLTHNRLPVWILWYWKWLRCNTQTQTMLDRFSLIQNIRWKDTLCQHGIYPHRWKDSCIQWPTATLVYVYKHTPIQIRVDEIPPQAACAVTLLSHIVFEVDFSYSKSGSFPIEDLQWSAAWALSTERGTLKTELLPITQTYQNQQIFDSYCYHVRGLVSAYSWLNNSPVTLSLSVYSSNTWTHHECQIQFIVPSAYFDSTNFQQDGEWHVVGNYASEINPHSRGVVFEHRWDRRLLFAHLSSQEIL